MPRFFVRRESGCDRRLGAEKLSPKGDFDLGGSMRMLKLAVAATIAVTATVGLAPSAFAVEEIDCSEAGTVKINWREQSGASRATCFSEAGTLGVTLPRSSSVEGGTNSGWVEYTGPNGTLDRVTFDVGQIIQINGWTISRVRIY